MKFDDKYIDYSLKTKKEIYESIILFSILSNKYVVFLGKFLLNVALVLHLPITFFIKKTIFKHFCGGETINESKLKINQLGQKNIKTILDYSIEGKNDDKVFKNTYKEIIKNIETAKTNKLIPFCVFKLTGISSFNLLQKLNNKIDLNKEEKQELYILNKRLHHICKKATTCNIPVLIDAEESWIQDAIDAIVENLMFTYNQNQVIIYNTIQLYRWDKLKDIIALHKKTEMKNIKIGLKLVRGAYMEKENKRAKKNNYKSPIHNSKKSCDQDYNKAVKYCIKNITNISLCFGTHNEKSTELILDLMKKNNIKNSDQRIYFSQLLGMSDNISYYLAHFKYNVAKYVPYGPVKEVLPYLIRRAEENSAITGQTKKEVQRLKKALNKL